MLQFLKRAWHDVLQANYSYFPNGFVHPDRVMDAHDLIYLIEGEWEIWLGETPYLLTPDHVLILPAGVHHYGKIPCREKTRTMYLHISGFPGEGEAPPRRAEGFLLPELIDCRNSKPVYRMFADMINAFWGPAPDKEVELSAKVQLLFCLLSRQEVSPAPDPHRIAMLTKAIQENPERFFTIQELAGLVHLHPRTISGEFKRITGQTIHQYQLDIKLQMAYSEILAYPNRSFREIAGAYGFYDEFHFSKSFKSKFGFPPKFLRDRAL